MSLWRLIFRGLIFHRRMHLAVLLGVLTAGIVLTGALVVGDSVRGSLRDLALDRLGRVEQLLIAPRFFRAALAKSATPPQATVRHGILLQAALSYTAESVTRRAGQVQVLGLAPAGWSLNRWDWLRRHDSLQADASNLPNDAVIVNASTANKLGLTDAVWEQSLRDQAPPEIVLRVPQPSDIPPDSALGRKTETSLSRRFRVLGIIVDQGWGRFSLSPSQQPPRAAFVSLAALQSLLKQQEKANLLLAADTTSSELEACLRPTAEDYGVRIDPLSDNRLQVSCDTLILEPTLESAVRSWANGRKLAIEPSLVYLANWIEAGPKQRIPYSTVAAIAWEDQLRNEIWPGADGQPLPLPGPEDIILNQWAAEDLQAQGAELKVGDPLWLTFFEPESTHGEVVERRVKFILRGIAPLSGRAADRLLTPEMKGITDKKSLTNWDPPFPYDPTRVRSVKPNDIDERYWEEYKALPKAFIQYTTGQVLWSGRFGKSTSLRFAVPSSGTPDDCRADLIAALPRAELGFRWIPIREQGLAAAAGTTPFDGLFLGFSLFLIAAAVALIMLLFRLGLEHRAREVGVVTANGFTSRRMAALYLGEGAITAAAGSFLGALGGIAFAALLLHGLRTWWVAAVVTPFMELHVTPRALVLGFVIAFIVAVMTLAWTLRKLLCYPVRELLAGKVATGSVNGRIPAKWPIVLCALSAGGLFLGGLLLTGQSRAGAWLGGGFLLLVTLWFALRRRWSLPVARGNVAMHNWWTLAASNLRRAPGRSLLTLGLMSAAVFLLTAISAFRLQPPPVGGDRNQGDGGYALLAQSDLPLYPDLADSTQRLEKLNIEPTVEELLARATIIPARVRAGDDASCLNLYKPRQPRVIGVGPRWVDRGGFAWAASDRQYDNPWAALDVDPTIDTASGRPIYPVVLDQNTAMYSLQLYRGVGERFVIEDDAGNTLQLVVAGLLQNSILQGDLLVAEKHFRRLYPRVNGTRFFLIEPAAGDDPDQVAQGLEDSLSEYGLLVESTRTRLISLMNVQNTYLSTFQTLGGLGLVLGAVGVAVVQLRNSWERRGELALMQALGFAHVQLRNLLTRESLLLLLVGLLLGVVTALPAVLPAWWQGDGGIPWFTLGATLCGVLMCGLVAGRWGAKQALNEDLVITLRNEA